MFLFFWSFVDEFGKVFFWILGVNSRIDGVACRGLRLKVMVGEGTGEVVAVMVVGGCVFDMGQCRPG